MLFISNTKIESVGFTGLLHKKDGADQSVFNVSASLFKRLLVCTHVQKKCARKSSLFERHAVPLCSSKLLLTDLKWRVCDNSLNIPTGIYELTL